MGRLLQEVCATFPNFPEPVAQTWLLHYAESRGWPPFVPHTLTFSRAWHAIFRNLEYGWWLSLQWDLVEVANPIAKPAPRDQCIVDDLIATYVHGSQTTYSRISDGPERFHGILSYLRANLSLPQPPILVTVRDGIGIADGCHRLAAWHYRSLEHSQATRAITTWLGTSTSWAHGT